MYINAISSCLSDETKDLMSCYNQFGLDKTQATIFSRFYGYNLCRQDDLSLKEMVFKALSRIFETHEMNKDKIKWIIHCHTGKIIEPEEFNILHDIKTYFSLNNAIAFGTSINNCSSAIIGIEKCKKLLRNDEKALIICADLCFHKGLKLIKNSAICNPGCTSLIVSQHGKDHKIKSISTNIDAQFYSGTADDNNKTLWNEIYTRGVVKTIRQACDNANIPLRDIKWIIPHNINKLAWKQISNSLGVGIDIVYLKGIEKYGHVFSSDNWLNLKDMIEEGILKKNDYYLVFSSGTGFIHSAIILRY